MIIKHFGLNKQNTNKYNIFLMYGKNEGLKNEILHCQFINEFEGQIDKYDEIEFISNKDAIISKFLNKSLFEEKKIIIISRATDKSSKIVEEILEKRLIDTKIILKSNELEKKSKLRTLFEKNKDLVIIPFYEDDLKNLSVIIDKFLIKNNIKLSRESINLIANRASGNRENLKIELDKILNYSYTNDKIELSNIEKLTNLAENYDVNQLADSFLNKNRNKITKILNENNYGDDDCILILRTILSKSKRLVKIIENYKRTKNLDMVLSNVRPPIFWKDLENVKKQVITWELTELRQKIYDINEIEYSIKSNSGNSLNLLSNFIINY
ncbi:DNA polymerase III subunit delta [Candidatus Pelagibacter sp.]|nr:DNA polymerase III subunit delta [Candidatus Pelagibacter sp.]